MTSQPTLTATDERSGFERWISARPFEKDVLRYGDDQAWPGAYIDYAVHLAWEAWQRRALDTNP